MTKGTPFCSATWAIAVLCPESNAPTSSCAPSLISFSARERATSTLVSVSALMISSVGIPSSLRMPLVISTPRWQSWPMPACTPERGSNTPTFKAAPCARTILKGETPATTPTAPSPALNFRRVTRAAFDCDVYFIGCSSLARHSAYLANDAGFFPSFTRSKTMAAAGVSGRPSVPFWWQSAGHIVD